MSSSTIGLFTGLILGIAWVTGEFDAFVGTALLGLIGFVVGKIAADRSTCSTISAARSAGDDHR